MANWGHPYKSASASSLAAFWIFARQVPLFRLKSRATSHHRHAAINHTSAPTFHHSPNTNKTRTKIGNYRTRAQRDPLRPH